MAKDKINSLDRYRKRSPNLILEQHGSCEVPAGCGGVILRWRNPRALRPVRVQVYTSGKVTCWIDGEPLKRGSVDLAPGPHVLALEVTDANPAWLLRAVLTHDTDGISADGSVDREAPFRLLSRGDGTWLGTTEAPAEGWQSAGFDSSGWALLTECPVPRPPVQEHGYYSWHSCEEAGAAGLALPGAPSGATVRVRRAFDIPSLLTP